MSSVQHLPYNPTADVYGFSEAIGYSCGITSKVTSDVVVRCEAYVAMAWNIRKAVEDGEA